MLAFQNSTMLEFDHLFVFCSVGALEADVILQHGFAEGTSNRHLGQGTANRRIFFDNAMLEFLWVEDAAEAQHPVVQPTRLWERSRYRQTGYSPFGVGLRTVGEAGSYAFPTKPYQPPYLPPALQIDIAITPAAEPLIFVIPFGQRPDQLQGTYQQPLNHACGCREITQVRIGVVADMAPSKPVQALNSAGIISIARGAEVVAEVELGHSRQQQSIDCRPHLPLILRW